MAPVIALTGPTASGKSELALGIAERWGGEIICADSVQAYRGFDVGSAKPSAEERARVPHHLIDIRDPDEPFGAAEFRRLAIERITDIRARGRRALVVGGTGFYLKALALGVWDAPPADEELRRRLEARSGEDLHAELAGLAPEAAGAIHPRDRYRLVRAIEVLRGGGRMEPVRDPRDPVVLPWAIDRAKAELDARILERAREMVASGIAREALSLRARFPGARALGSVGYREALVGADSGAHGHALVDAIALATRQLAKRQRTFIRGQLAPIDGYRAFQLPEDEGALQAAISEVWGD